MRKKALVAFLIISLLLIFYIQAISWKWASVFLLLLGSFSLIAGSDLFVEGAAGFAAKFGISEHAIGLTIVAFGTSLPEFAVSFIAALQKHAPISIGNVLGSNVTNILLIMGIAILIMPLKPSKFAFKDSIYMVVISVALLPMALDGKLQIYDGIILLSFYALFIYLLYKRKDIEAACETKTGFPLALFFLIMGSIAIAIGGDATVGGAIGMAKIMNVRELAVAASIVAFGTSLPEFMTSVMATIKRYHGIAIGNIIGSNIVNLGVVLGSSCIVRNISVSMNSMFLFFILSSFIALIVVGKKWYGRSAGIIFLLLYILFIILLYV